MDGGVAGERQGGKGFFFNFIKMKVIKPVFQINEEDKMMI